MFRLQPQAVEEQETDRLQQLYLEWERRILWPKNNSESAIEIKSRTRQQEIHEWEDWALENMDKSLVELQWA